MSKITINGTVFDGESVLRAVERVAPLPGGGEVVRGGWKFLYWVDTQGNGNSMCFAVCGGNAATEKGGA